LDPRNICVVGLGYIGLPTASLLATKGHRVLGVDVNPHVVATINAGGIHVKEPELDVLVKAAVASGNLRAALRPEPADVFIIAVPTPFRENHAPDVSYVDAATEAIAPVIAAGSVVVLESTSPVGTSERIHERLAALRPELVGKDRFFVAHCPERVLPGHILRELVENDRIVGGIDVDSTHKAVAFYETFVSGAVIATDARTAELCKLVENSFRDLNIAFANELSMICHDLGMNVWEVIRMANRHPRVNILSPGPGVGGHCLAVDPWFIVHSAPDTAKLIRLGREVNERKAHFVAEQVLAKAERFKKPVIACLGLAYKPDIDDLRESPSVEIAHELAKKVDGTVLVVEPNVKSHPDFTLTDLHVALRDADIIVGLVSHREFKKIDPEILKSKVVVDTCGAFR
jgi:UDP-N-acetyl-D-mannosaminuronic acid dehydrogenase